MLQKKNAERERKREREKEREIEREHGGGTAACAPPSLPLHLSILDARPALQVT